MNKNLKKDVTHLLVFFIFLPLFSVAYAAIPQVYISEPIINKVINSKDYFEKPYYSSNENEKIFQDLSNPSIHFEYINFNVEEENSSTPFDMLHFNEGKPMLTFQFKVPFF